MLVSILTGEKEEEAKQLRKHASIYFIVGP